MNSCCHDKDLKFHLMWNRKLLKNSGQGKTFDQVLFFNIFQYICVENVLVGEQDKYKEKFFTRILQILLILFSYWE